MLQELIPQAGHIPKEFALKFRQVRGSSTENLTKRIA